MKFDSNLAWKEASSAIAANREVLLALAGVFFLLPTLAFSLLMPAPVQQPDAAPQQQIAAMQAYYIASMPFLIPMTVIQAAGTLGLLSLFTDRRRPTVGQAIGLGFVGLLPYIAAQLLMGIAVGLAFGIGFAIAAATGVGALAGIVVVLGLVGVAYVMIKTSLTAPVIMVEGVRNPIAALTRSWRLTKGNSVRLGLFYLLLGLVFVVVISIVVAVVGLIAALAAGSETGKVIGDVVSAALGSVMTLYFVAAIAAAHRQLAGPSAERVSETFE